MSHIFTITVSDAEYKALSVAAVDPQDWVENAVHNRCRISIEEIVNSEVQRKLAAGETISGTKEDIVLAADIETAAEREARLEQIRNTLVE
jgi:hypothetical protein